MDSVFFALSKDDDGLNNKTVKSYDSFELLFLIILINVEPLNIIFYKLCIKKDLYSRLRIRIHIVFIHMVIISYSCIWCYIHGYVGVVGSIYIPQYSLRS